MAREFTRRGDEVSILTFRLQYPRALFPGKTQTVSTPPPADLRIERAINTINPFNWIRVGLRLRREAPDIVLLKYWTPFMAPCFGTIARIARSNAHTKFICQIDNVEPHEHHFVDRAFNRYFLRSTDGFVYMSEQVHGELRSYTSAPALFSPHPVFEHFGEAVPRDEACRRLKLNPRYGYVLFFGLIRDYKGLDLLLEAWRRLRPKGKRLIVAGEFYANRSKYAEALAALGDDVVLFDYFVSDADVKYFFSAAELLVLPYRTATQSGVTQIAYRFGTPMIVTRVGGLPEIVHDNVSGFVCEPDVDDVARAISRMYEGSTLARIREGVIAERHRFSWGAMCDRIMDVYNKVLGA